MCTTKEDTRGRRRITNVLMFYMLEFTLTWFIWESQSFAVFQGRQKCDEEVNGRNPLSKSVKPAVQTGHFVKTLPCISETFKAFLKPHRLPIQFISTWAACTFHFDATRHFSRFIRLRPEHRLRDLFFVCWFCFVFCLFAFFCCCCSFGFFCNINLWDQFSCRCWRLITSSRPLRPPSVPSRQPVTA